MAVAGKMKAGDYRKLVSRILLKYRRPLNLWRLDACELADLVYWGEMTEARVFEHLDSAVDCETRNPIATRGSANG